MRAGVGGVGTIILMLVVVLYNTTFTEKVRIRTGTGTIRRGLSNRIFHFRILTGDSDGRSRRLGVGIGRTIMSCVYRGLSSTKGTTRTGT